MKKVLGMSVATLALLGGGAFVAYMMFRNSAAQAATAATAPTTPDPAQLTNQSGDPGEYGAGYGGGPQGSAYQGAPYSGGYGSAGAGAQPSRRWARQHPHQALTSMQHPNRYARRHGGGGDGGYGGGGDYGGGYDSGAYADPYGALTGDLGGNDYGGNLEG